MGDSRKYPYLYHGWLLGFPKGSGGSRLWNFEGMGGIYDWKSWGDFTCGNFTCGISGVESGVSSLKTLIAVDLSSS